MEKKKNSQDEVATLNSKAIQIIEAGKENGDTTSSLLKADSILSIAMSLDSMQVQTYINKAKTLCNLKKYDEAISVIEKLKSLKENYAEAYAFQGFVYETIGEKEKALKEYSASYNAYEKRIEKKKDNLYDRVNKVIMLMFLYKENEAKEEMAKTLNDYPNDDIVINGKYQLENFNRQNFLNSIYH
ncbi:MAG: hypothetical protein K2X86_00680 [Cytophagaceae bacterium]|nr:hypothetical protein [Cytophagaceae bacterium]